MLELQYWADGVNRIIAAANNHFTSSGPSITNTCKLLGLSKIALQSENQQKRLRFYVNMLVDAFELF
jgi:hypothetical protein